MGLAESQKFLARLATDGALRARFVANPAEVAAEFGLSLDESREFASLLPGPIAGFAGSLIRKRRGEVESLLPLTFRALGPLRFASLFRGHAAKFVPSGIKKHRDDAVEFAELIAREVADPAWLGDLARLEAAAMLAHDPARRWLGLGLRYHPADLGRASAESAIPPRSSWIVWFRIFPQSRLRRLVVGRPW